MGVAKNKTIIKLETNLAKSVDKKIIQAKRKTEK